MRKYLVIAACALVTACSVSADVIDPNYHFLARCITFGNLDAFPDIVVVAAIKNVTQKEFVSSYVVKADSCLNKGYKFNSFYLLWVEKTYYDSIGRENLDFDKYLPQPSAKRMAGSTVAPRMGLLEGCVDPLGGLLHDTIPIVEERLVYNLKTDPLKGFIAYLIKKTTVDKDGIEHQETYSTSVTYPAAARKNQTMLINAYLNKNRLQFTAVFNGSLSGELIDCRGRVVQRFSRDVTDGSAYLVPCPGVSAGMYWLRVHTINNVTTQRLQVFD